MLNCFPTTDVHLLTATGRDQGLDLYLFTRWPPDAATAAWTDLSTVPALKLELKVVPAAATVTEHVPGSASPSAGPVFTIHPASVGTGVAQTSLSHPSLTVPQMLALQGTVRITVHADIKRFWIPVASIEMFAGESNWLVPITAIFDDDSQGDVTSHRYWSYDTSDHAIATVDGDGRVRAHAEGFVTITVTLRGSTRTQTVRATIRPALTSGHPGAQVIKWGSVAGDRSRVYILSEGYDDRFASRTTARRS